MWPREELESAFQHYVRVTQTCALSGKWQPWADLFTEDVDYRIDGDLTWKGRDTVREGSMGFFSVPPYDHMRHFIIDWYAIDEKRGWVVFEITQRMDDPGDGSTHELKCLMRITYAGDLQWSAEDDYYDPTRMEAMVAGWQEAHKGAS